MNYEKNFLALGSEIPSTEPSVPKGCNFVLYRRLGNLITLSGYGPFIGSDIPAQYKGRLGVNVDVPTGYQAARLTCINLLLIARQAAKTLNHIEKIIEVTGFVSCAPSFTQQPDVMNGCSDLLVNIFGDVGKHIRAAIGVSALAFNICVEISMSFEVKHS